MKPEVKMKKILILGFVLGALSLTNCTKDIEENPSVGAENIETTYTFTAVTDDSRTAYVQGDGVRITGDETVGVVFSAINSDGTVVAVDKQKQEAKPVEGQQFTYSFIAPSLAEGLSAVEKYFFVLPNGNETRGTVINNPDCIPVLLPTVQCPLNTASFDPDADVLVGKPQTPDALKDGNVTISFKRLFTPVRLVVKGISDKKLYSLTFKSVNGSVMTGYASEVKCVEDYAESGVKKWHSSRKSSGATIVYSTGLDADENGNFNVWMVANPGDFSDLTVTVTTENRVLSRSINSTVNIPERKLKEIGIDMKSATELYSKSITFDFLNADGTPVAELKGRNAKGNLNGSDGVSYEWALSGNAQSYGNRGLYLPKVDAKVNPNGGAVVLPALGDGKQLAVVRGVVDKIQHGNGAKVVVEKSSDNGETWNEVPGIDESETNLDRNPLEYNRQGVFEINIPAQQQSGTDRFRIRNTSTANAYFRNLTLIWSDGSEVPPVEAKTYYDKYMAGEDIVIANGIVVNNKNYSKCVKVDIANLTNKHFIEGGLVFIDGEGSYTMTSSPSMHTSAIIIGNNSEKQPTIICNNNGSAEYFAVRGEDCDYVFKNLNIDGSTNSYIFANSDNTAEGASGKLKNIILEDCTIVTNGNVIHDSNTTNSMQNVSVSNCVIKMPTGSTGKAVYGWATKLTDKNLDQIKTVTLTNNVVYVSEPINHYLVMVGGKETDPTTKKFTAYDSNATITVEGNTTYNIYHGNGIVSAYGAADIQVNKNVSYFDNSTLKKNSYYAGYSKPNDSKSFTVKNNYAYTNNGDTQYWKALWKGTDVTAKTIAEDNYFKPNEKPFVSENVETGYFPINTAVVTNGAGATYDTKLWNTWE